MTEVSKRVWPIAARAAGNTVGPAIAALMTTAGVALGQPDLAFWAVPSGALAGSMTEEGVGLVRAAWEDRAEKIQRFIDTAADDAGEAIEDLIAAAIKDSRLRALLSQAVESATRALDDEKVDILAKAFARGARDGAVVDELLILVELVKNLEIAHIRILRIVYDDTKSSDEPVGGVGVTESRLLEMDPGLRSTVGLLCGQLQQAGMLEIYDRANGKEWKITRLGFDCAKSLRQLSGPPNQDRE